MALRMLVVLLLVIPTVREGPGGVGGTLMAAPAPPGPSLNARDDTDYDKELQRIETELATAKDVKRVQLLYQRAALTNDFKDFRAVELALAKTNLPVVKAHLDYTLHRLPQAKKCNCDPALMADIAYQEGRNREANRMYQALPPTWDNLARRAYFLSKIGQDRAADALYAKAAEELTAKQMRDFAWVELQRGILDLENGHQAKALAHYERAAAAWSGWWLIDEHRAEALYLVGRTDEAIALYRDVIARTRKPEIISALAAILKSEEMFVEADEGFEAEMAMYPEAAIAHYVKHLMMRGGDRDLIVKLAQRNYEMRPNLDAKFLLERAKLYTNRFVR